MAEKTIFKATNEEFSEILKSFLTKSEFKSFISEERTNKIIKMIKNVKLNSKEIIKCLILSPLKEEDPFSKYTIDSLLSNEDKKLCLLLKNILEELLLPYRK